MLTQSTSIIDNDGIVERSNNFSGNLTEQSVYEFLKYELAHHDEQLDSWIADNLITMLVLIAYLKSVFLSFFSFSLILML